MKTKYDSVLGKLRESDEADLEGVIRQGFNKLEADGCTAAIPTDYTDDYDDIIEVTSTYFTVAGDATGRYELGKALRVVNVSGPKLYVITNVDYSTNTTVSVTPNISGTYYGISNFKIYYNQIISGSNIALGKNSIASGAHSFACGKETEASGENSHASGKGTIASGEASHAEGFDTLASGERSHAEGFDTLASGIYSHAEGNETNALGTASHAEGFDTLASGIYSHAEGCMTKSTGYNSHVEGIYAEASKSTSHAGGKGSKTIADFDMVRGNTGSTANTANNIFRVHGDNGNVTCDGAFTGGGADYAETFEWDDQNTQSEDRAGYFVELVNGDKIQKYSQYGEAPLGIVSAMPAVVGDAHFLKWQGIWQLDDFGRKVLETRWKRALKAGQEYYKDDADNIWKYHESPTNKEPIPFDEGTLIPENLDWKPYNFPKLNPDYVIGQEYIPRLERKEWDAIGFIGKLRVFDDGQAVAGNWIKPVAGGTAEKTTASAAIKYRVLKRISDNVIEILFR